MTESDDGRVATGDRPSLDRDVRWRQVAQRRYEPDRDGGLTTAIVFAIADAEGIPPRELKSPPLYDVVDVVGIEQTFFGLDPAESARRGTGMVEFRYTDYLVTVRSDGWIQVYAPAEAE
jgi:hypothetical protein